MPNKSEHVPLLPNITAKIDQRLAMLKQLSGWPFAVDVIMCQLTDPPNLCTQEEYAKWDRSCDSCDTFVPLGTNFNGLAYSTTKDGKWITICYSLCDDCFTRAQAKA